MTRRYLNAEYPHPRSPGQRVEGKDLWVSATVKRGRRPEPPTLVWYAERAAAGGDQNFQEDHFIPDPTFEVPGGQDESDTRWAKVAVPDVTGLTWRFRVRRSKLGKADKVVRVRGEVETWRRFFLDVNADNEALYRLYSAAFSHVRDAFAEAQIEVVENVVKVDGAAKFGKGTDKSRRDGRRLGTVYTVTMHPPQVDSVGQELTIIVANGATNCGAFARVVGNTLELTLAEGASWKTRPSDGFTATAGGQTLAEFAQWGKIDAITGENALARETLSQVCERVDDRTARIHLDHARLSNGYNTGTRAWDTPRAQTVLQAFQTGPLELKLDLRYDLRGATGGMNVGGGVNFETFIDANPLKLACVLAHEFAHGRGLVKPHFVRRHGAPQLEYTDTVPARVPLNARVPNALHYDADYGGSGTHCKLGAEELDSCVTRARRTFKPQTGQAMCLMFHASVIDEQGRPRTQGGRARFCPSCIRQLRGL